MAIAVKSTKPGQRKNSAQAAVAPEAADVPAAVDSIEAAAAETEEVVAEIEAVAAAEDTQPVFK